MKMSIDKRFVRKDMFPLTDHASGRVSSEPPLLESNFPQFEWTIPSIVSSVIERENADQS
jgi:hypothetical protein